MDCWLVTDSEFNRQYNKGIIGQRFQFAPSNCDVEAIVMYPWCVWLNKEEYLRVMWGCCKDNN